MIVLKKLLLGGMIALPVLTQTALGMDQDFGIECSIIRRGVDFNPIRHVNNLTPTVDNAPWIIAVGPYNKIPYQPSRHPLDFAVDTSSSATYRTVLDQSFEGHHAGETNLMFRLSVDEVLNRPLGRQWFGNQTTDNNHDLHSRKMRTTLESCGWDDSVKTMVPDTEYAQWHGNDYVCTDLSHVYDYFLRLVENHMLSENCANAMLDHIVATNAFDPWIILNIKVSASVMEIGSQEWLDALSNISKESCGFLDARIALADWYTNDSRQEDLYQRYISAMNVLEGVIKEDKVQIQVRDFLRAFALAKYNLDIPRNVDILLNTALSYEILEKQTIEMFLQAINSLAAEHEATTETNSNSKKRTREDDEDGDRGGIKKQRVEE